MNNNHRWISTSVPPAGRFDDIFFLNDQVGWAVGGGGQVLKTTNGGKTFPRVGRISGTTLRCIGMRDEDVGWVGQIRGNPPLFCTSDGGTSWMPVGNLPKVRKSRLEADAPTGVCGLQVLDKEHIFATGTNYPQQPTRFLKSGNGGGTWTARDMEDRATILVDIWFTSPNVGWLVGARGTKPYSLRADVIPVVLKTEDGGRNWTDKLNPEINPPLGEWGWKIQFVDDDFIVVACENFKTGSVLISEDRGENWRRQEIRNDKGVLVNANLEGIGFLDRKTGWVGGWGDEAISSGRTSVTHDGGVTWRDLTKDWPRPRAPFIGCEADRDKGQYINRFRFVNGFGYAAGNTIYKYTDEPEENFGQIPQTTRTFITSDSPLLYDEGAEIPVMLELGSKSLRIDIFDRFGDRVKTLADESSPATGARSFEWDMCDENGETLPIGQFLVTVTVDNDVECRLMFHRGSSVPDPKQSYVPYMLEGL